VVNLALLQVWFTIWLVMRFRKYRYLRLQEMVQAVPGLLTSLHHKMRWLFPIVLQSLGQFWLEQP
jgi:hypothetical protein